MPPPSMTLIVSCSFLLLVVSAFAIGTRLGTEKPSFLDVEGEKSANKSRFKTIRSDLRYAALYLRSTGGSKPSGERSVVPKFLEEGFQNLSQYFSAENYEEPPQVGVAVSAGPPSGQSKKALVSDIGLPPELVRRIEAQASGEGLGGGLLPKPQPIPNRSARSSSGGSSHIQNIGQGSSAATASNDSRAFSYRVHRFLPGLTRSEVPIHAVPTDLTELHSRVVGAPDFSLVTVIPQLENILSLGNCGSITFEVVDGFVVDGEGADFLVFENPFIVNGTDGAQVFAETAIVSVSETDEVTQVRYFPCDSTTSPYRGCAGVIPVSYSDQLPLDQVGGDPFDLKDVGLEKIKYITIEDTCDNESFLEGTEGFDLDSIALIHTDIP